MYRGYEDAREQAREAEHALTSGEELGPLHGVPTAMKDLFDFKPGWVSTFGGIRALESLFGKGEGWDGFVRYLL